MGEDFPYSYLVTYGDVDAQKVTYNGRYLDIVDDFLHRFVNGGDMELPSQAKVRVVIFDFLAPSRLGDQINVAIDRFEALIPSKPVESKSNAYSLQLSFFVGTSKISTVAIEFESCISSG